MPLIGLRKSNGPNGFGHNTTAEQVTEGLDLSGKTYLLTGCNSGIGLETLRVIALRGGHVIAAARTKEKAQTAIKRTKSEGNATPIACELSDPGSVRAAVNEIKALGRPLDGIICNAGIMALPKPERKYGLELQFFTNHIGHFILVTGLLDTLAADSRVVITASEAHRRAPREGIRFDDLGAEKEYTPWSSYGHSKLANILFAKELARRFDGNGRTANSLHPGVIHTGLVRHMNPLVNIVLTIARPFFLKSVAQGAATQCYLATHPNASAHNGEYFSDCNPARPTRPGRDGEMAQRLWDVSEEITSRI